MAKENAKVAAPSARTVKRGRSEEVIMRSIFEAEVKCLSCGWTGTVGTCGDVQHADGCLDCPVCHSVVIDDSPEARKTQGVDHKLEDVWSISLE